MKWPGEQQGHGDFMSFKLAAYEMRYGREKNRRRAVDVKSNTVVKIQKGKSHSGSAGL